MERRVGHDHVVAIRQADCDIVPAKIKFHLRCQRRQVGPRQRQRAGLRFVDIQRGDASAALQQFGREETIARAQIRRAPVQVRGQMLGQQCGGGVDAVPREYAGTAGEAATDDGPRRIEVTPLRR